MNETAADGIALIFAAGSGRRLGLGPKALLPWGDSVLIVRAVRAARRARLRTVVTAGPGHREIASHLAEAGLTDPMVTLAEVADASIGMSASFRAGIAAVGELVGGESARAVVGLRGVVGSVPAASARSDSGEPRLPARSPVTMMLVDQPWVGADVLSRLNARFDPARVVRAAWSGAPGHPVVMSLEHARQAADLAQGDEAGRSWMRSHGHLIDGVECSDLGSGTDIDTPADLADTVAAGLRTT